MLFVKATLMDGEAVIVEFDKLKGIRQLSADVMGGRKAFPIWRKVSERHPVSNEPVLVRTRTFLRGDQIKEMQVVKPREGFDDTHNLQPEHFEAEVHMKSGRDGLWKAPSGEGAVVGAQAGTDYPIHRDEATHRRYVILAWDENEAEQVRHFLDAESAGVTESRSYEDDGDGEWDEEDRW